MSDESTRRIPVWTLATSELNLPDVIGRSDLTPERLAELRSVLAGLAASPIATLEVHPIDKRRDRKDGIALQAASPLARQLAKLVSDTAGSGIAGKSVSQAVDAATSGEVLYRMVLPAKVAAQVGQGLVKPMASKAVEGGIHGGLRSSSRIVANAAFVPVAAKGATATAAGAGGALGAAGATGGVAASAGVITVAAPLVLMAVAVGVSAYAENQRQEAIERITDLLEQLHEDSLDKERSGLDGSRDAIEKATSILLDKGRIGHSLGLDSAAYAIATAIETARRRLIKWQGALDKLPDGPVDLGVLIKAFPGITESGGTFRAHVELARLAIALRRRVMILQAVEHAQADAESNPFANFVSALHEDERRINALEASVDDVLVRLSKVELKRQGGFRSPVYSAGEVDSLLAAVYRLRSLGGELNVGSDHADVAIEIERGKDGSLVVFPAVAV